MDALLVWVSIPEEVPSNCVFKTFKIYGFTLSIGLLLKWFLLFNYNLIWEMMMVYGYIVVVLIVFAKNLSWTHGSFSS